VLGYKESEVDETKLFDALNNPNIKEKTNWEVKSMKL